MSFLSVRKQVNQIFTYFYFYRIPNTIDRIPVTCSLFHCNDLSVHYHFIQTLIRRLLYLGYEYSGNCQLIKTYVLLIPYSFHQLHTQYLLLTIHIMIMYPLKFWTSSWCKRLTVSYSHISGLLMLCWTPVCKPWVSQGQRQRQNVLQLCPVADSIIYLLWSCNSSSQCKLQLSGFKQCIFIIILY